MRKIFILSIIGGLSMVIFLCSCKLSEAGQQSVTDAPFFWENANIYFLLTDRFKNGDPSNDLNFDRSGQTAKLRGFEGGDIKGVIQKIQEGYFNKLGITALWLTPWFEQIHGGTDEGTGNTYGYHGYWTSDWTSMDPNFGTERELAQLVENLPDIRTESLEPVSLPPQLLEKWQKEGRLEQETSELGKEAQLAFKAWKRDNPDGILDDQDFFMVAEIYGYGITAGRNFSFGDREVDYFENGIQSMINFEFKQSAKSNYEKLFSSYSEMLHGELAGYGVLNYISSHDDGGPFDSDRSKPIEAATKLLLCPGASQVYYGDESSRELIIAGTNGDATLRSPMNWEEIESNTIRNGVSIHDILEHYQKLGKFRRDHPSVGAGLHQMLQQRPYIFSRTFERNGYTDQVVVGMDLDKGIKKINVKSLFHEGTELYDYYSETFASVTEGEIKLNSDFHMALLGIKNR